MKPGFKILKSHCPNGVEQLTRDALEIIGAKGGQALEVSYEISPTGEQCVGIVFESNELRATYAALDAMPEPPNAGTTVRRKPQP